MHGAGIPALLDGQLPHLRGARPVPTAAVVAKQRISSPQVEPDASSRADSPYPQGQLVRNVLSVGECGGDKTKEEAMAEGSQTDKKSHIVLVAEDDREVRDLLKLEFELEGFTVLTAANGAEAITTAERWKPDVILMDVLMPVVDGIEATRRLLSEKATKHIPVLMLTVVDNKEEAIHALQAGAFDYITKPLFLPELKARINAALRYKRLYDELIVIRKQSVDNEKLQALKEIFSGIQESIVSKLTVIMAKVDIIRSKEGNASKEDLSSILNAALKINRSINNLNIFDFYPPSLMPNGQNMVDFNGLHWGGAHFQR